MGSNVNIAGDIIKPADKYAAHTGKKLSTLSTYSANDGKLFAHLKAGGGCTIKTAEKVVEWFDPNWADDLKWPGEIMRPSKKRRVA